MREAFKTRETRHLAPGTSGRDANPPKDEVCRPKASERAEDHDCADPAQRNLMEVIPNPPSGLDKDALALVRLVNVPFDAWELLKQGLLIDDARLRIDS